MNRLTAERRAQVLGCLTEGMSVRSTVRATGAAKSTVTNLLVAAGQAFAEYQDGAFQNLGTTRVECDEIWGFCYAKQKNVPEEYQGTPGYGDVWTWTAIDADTKLIPSWLVGERTRGDCYAFIKDLHSRIRDGNRVQITTDGLSHYVDVIEPIFGRGKVDFATLHKNYGKVENEQRYSPAVCTGTECRIQAGDPEPRLTSTSYVERQNLTMRMGMRRFTRLTNAFSKKIENLAHAVSLHFMHYNFCRPHQTLTKLVGTPTTPAMAEGLAQYPWSLHQLVGVLEEWERAV